MCHNALHFDESQRFALEQPDCVCHMCVCTSSFLFHICTFAGASRASSTARLLSSEQLLRARLRRGELQPALEFVLCLRDSDDQFLCASLLLNHLLRLEAHPFVNPSSK